MTGSVAMGRVLHAAGADLTIRNRFGGISVIPASERGHVDYVRWVTTSTDIDVDFTSTARLDGPAGGGDPGRRRPGALRRSCGRCRPRRRPVAGRRRGIALEHARARGHGEPVPSSAAG
ncbi:MAG: hypothetical protein R2749_13340 [Acidimicrobiales bacterium]